MYKTFFPPSNVNELNKSIKRNLVLHAYNNSSIPKMDIHKAIIFNKGTEYQYNFFVVPGNEPVILGMPDCEQL